MIDKGVTPVDRMAGVVAYTGGKPRRAVRQCDLKPGDVVLLDMERFDSDEVAFLKEERRWVVARETEDGEFLLSQATTKQSIAGQGLPGLHVEISRQCGFYAGFDNPDAIIHPALFRRFKKEEILGRVGFLSNDDWKAFQAGMDAGLGLGTGVAGSPGSGPSRRGTIWRHRRNDVQAVLMTCHEYSGTDGAPVPVIPMIAAKEGQQAPSDAVEVFDTAGQRFFAFPTDISLSEAGSPGADRDWIQDKKVSEPSAQAVDGALFDWMRLGDNEALKRPDPARRAFSMRKEQAIGAMDGSGRMKAVVKR